MSMLRAADSISSAVIPVWDRDEGLGDLSGGDTRGGALGRGWLA